MSSCGNIQIAGRNQSPLGIRARISTLPYLNSWGCQYLRHNLRHSEKEWWEWETHPMVATPLVLIRAVCTGLMTVLRASLETAVHAVRFLLVQLSRVYVPPS